jgi:hypothetical protein
MNEWLEQKINHDTNGIIFWIAVWLVSGFIFWLMKE